MKHLLLTTIAAVVLVGTVFADPIHDSGRNGDLAGTQAELDKGVDVDTKDDMGMTPLHVAAWYGHKEIAELLIDAGADANATTYWGSTPLHVAAQDGHKEIAELLIAAGADVTVKDDYGFTPVDHANIGIFWFPPEGIAAKKETADLLRKHGGISGAADSIHVAAAVGNIETVKQHLADGTDVNAKNDGGLTPLLQAAANGHKEIAELLITKGADVNVNVNGTTPLHIAAFNGHKEVAELLIANGADVNAKDEDGMTPLLHTITIYGYNKEIAELLIAAGGDVNAKDGEGGTPLDNLVYTANMWMWMESWGGSMGEEAWSQATELAEFLRKHGGMTSEELLMPHLVQHGRFAFSFDAKEGKVYEVQDSFDLLNWEVVRTYTGTGDSVRFDEERDHDPPKWFYRVRVVE